MSLLARALLSPGRYAGPLVKQGAKAVAPAALIAGLAQLPQLIAGSESGGTSSQGAGGSGGQQGGTTPGGKDYSAEAAENIAILKELIQSGFGQLAQAQQAATGLSQAELDYRRQLSERVLDPEFYKGRAQVDLEVWQKQAAQAQQAAMEQTKELTQRTLEKETINAWSAITQKQIDRDTQLAVGMMNLSATLGMPNPNVLQGMASSSRTGAAGFSPVPALY